MKKIQYFKSFLVKMGIIVLMAIFVFSFKFFNSLKNFFGGAPTRPQVAEKNSLIDKALGINIASADLSGCASCSCGCGCVSGCSGGCGGGCGGCY